MNEKELNQIKEIRNRSDVMHRAMGITGEGFVKELLLMVSPSVMPIVREHMANSVQDARVLLAAYDESQDGLEKLTAQIEKKYITKIEKLKAELAEYKAKENPCDFCLVSLLSEMGMNVGCSKCEHNTHKLSVLVTWMDDSELVYEVSSLSVDKDIDSLVLTTDTQDTVIPLHKIRQYTIKKK